MARAGSDANPIVFANAVLALLVIAVFCRPRVRGWPTCLLLAAMIVLANLAVILSGSRGVLPGLGLVVLWYDGRYVVTFTFFAAALLVLLVNVREATRR